jgi:CubicO group peptidase (beta-lactamase class C family)
MVSYLPPRGTPRSLEQIGFTDSTWDRPWNLFRGQITMAERMPSAVLEPGETVAWPTGSALDLARLEVEDPLTGRTMTLPQLLDSRLSSDGLLVVQGGRVIAERYSNSLVETDRHVVHSCSKTLTTMMVGIAIDEGRLDVEAEVGSYLPELGELDAWAGVTVQHLLDMATGLRTEEHYQDPESMYWRYAEAVGYYGPGRDGAGTFGFALAELRERAVEPGTLFNYASYLTNLLPVMLERVYERPAVELYEERLYSQIGAERPALINLDSQGRPIVEGQVNVTLRDFARWAYPFVNDGLGLTGARVIPERWVKETLTSSPERAAAFREAGRGESLPGVEYHNQAWILDPAREVMTMLGIHGQFAYIDRPRDLLIVGLSSYPDQSNPLQTALLTRVWDAVVAAV